MKAPQEWAGWVRQAASPGREAGGLPLWRGDRLDVACPLEGEGCVVWPKAESSQQRVVVGKGWGHYGALRAAEERGGWSLRLAWWGGGHVVLQHAGPAAEITCVKPNCPWSVGLLPAN